MLEIASNKLTSLHAVALTDLSRRTTRQSMLRLLCLVVLVKSSRNPHQPEQEDNKTEHPEVTRHLRVDVVPNVARSAPAHSLRLQDDNFDNNVDDDDDGNFNHDDHEVIHLLRLQALFFLHLGNRLLHPNAPLQPLKCYVIRVIIIIVPP